MFFVAHVGRDRETDAEPVCGPAGAERGTGLGGGEGVGGCFGESWAGEVGNGVDGEVYMVGVGGDCLEEFAIVLLV